MPKLPTYELSVTPQTNLVTPDFRHEGGLGALGREVGKVLQIRGKQLSDEYDTVKAVSAFNAFSDSSREMVQGLLKLESGAAEGAQNAYKEWYVKNQNNFTGMLNSQPQQALFKQMADRRRETDLNHLARHEATQYRIYKKETLDGNATSADLAIREAVVETLKTPGKDFTAADTVIEDFKNNLELMFPGHDLKSLNAKYTQLLRIAQIEEMMEVDPQSAREYIEKKEIKDQLSFVENGILKDAYPALKAKLKVEESRDNIDKAYHALAARFPTDPGKAIKAMYDEKIMKEFGLDVAERDRVVNTFKNEIAWARQQAEFNRIENADGERKQIFELMATGNMKQALDILDQSENFKAHEQTQIWNVIHTRASQYTDWEKYEQISKDIDDNKITKVSEITMYDSKGLGKPEVQQLTRRLSEHQKNPASTQFIKQAFDWYDAEFGDSAMMMELKPYIRSWLIDQVHDPKQNLKGPAIMQRLREEVGTRDDMYNKGWFDWGFWGAGALGAGEESTRAPVGQTIERLRAERKRRTEERKRTSEPVKSEFAPDSFAEIPESLKLEIENILRERGYAITDDNILKVYQRNKDKFSKTEDIGITF